MKKFYVILLLVLPLVFAACSDENAETEAETHAPTEPTTQEFISLSEMSPDEIDITLPDYLSMHSWEIDFSSFEEIEAKDSVFPESGHDKILKSENAQYFFVDNDIKVHAVFFDSEERVIASASYNTETGNLEFFGDDTTTWYYNEDGTLRCVVYTYSFDAGTPPIYTFYSPEGKKEVTRTMEGWYNTEFDMLTNDEIMDCLDKYAGTVESTAEYRVANGF